MKKRFSRDFLHGQMGKKRLPYSGRITTNITMRRIIDEQEKKDLFCI